MLFLLKIGQKNYLYSNHHLWRIFVQVTQVFTNLLVKPLYFSLVSDLSLYEKVQKKMKYFCLILILVLKIRFSTSNDAIEFRKEKIKEMMLHAWNNYKLYAWGKNELRPLSKNSYDFGIFGGHNIGLTIVDALDTLFLMNLTSEYEEGRDWIEKKFCLDEVDQKINVFETNIRFVGGFLSLYALTGNELYKEKAIHVGDKLLLAFKTPTGIPYRDVNFKTGETSGMPALLSEFGTLSLEFVYLSNITGDYKYKEAVDKIYKFLSDHKDKNLELFPLWLNPETGDWECKCYSIGSSGDSFYEYLLKSWIQTGKQNESVKILFTNAMHDIIQHGVQLNPDNLTYVSAINDVGPDGIMEHLSCFTGGLFALASNTITEKRLLSKYWNLAEEITKTCHVLYNFTATGLAPDSIFLLRSLKQDVASIYPLYLLRPETVESYFYMWRYSHNAIYREWAWEIVEALERYCRTPNGYVGIEDVFNKKSMKNDIQQSFFLAETLKYLYLLYSDDAILPLDKWVFNTEAHPLPILG